MTDAGKDGALTGVRVLDLSRVLAAPLAAQWLGDLGAEVIKVERPGAGDESRTYGPPFLTERDHGTTDGSAFFAACNRGKKSVTVDHSTPEGQKIVQALAARSDVVIENFRAGTLARYGLDYATLSAANPRLVYCSVTGFGQDGPYAARPGYDGIFQAMGGLMSVSGYPDEPMKVGVSMVDIITSLFSTIAILGALRHRDQVSGEGQYIDMALLDCGFAATTHMALDYLVSGKLHTRRGNSGYAGLPSQAFACSDRMIYIVAPNNRLFERLCKALGHPEFFADARFSTSPARIGNRDALVETLGTVLKTQPLAHWLEVLDEADVPASPVNEFPDVVENPQIQHRGMVVESEHPEAGLFKMLANPMRLTGTPITSYPPPPSLGQHTVEILDSLGIPASEREELARKGVV